MTFTETQGEYLLHPWILPGAGSTRELSLLSLRGQRTEMLLDQEEEERSIKDHNRL